MVCKKIPISGLVQLNRPFSNLSALTAPGFPPGSAGRAHTGAKFRSGDLTERILFDQPYPPPDGGFEVLVTAEDAMALVISIESGSNNESLQFLYTSLAIAMRVTPSSLDSVCFVCLCEWGVLLNEISQTFHFILASIYFFDVCYIVEKSRLVWLVLTGNGS